jgi:periplasmic copper chaperone A
VRRLLLLVVLLGFASPAFAQHNGIEIAHAWSRPAMAGHVGVAYLTVTDSGAPDRLTGASTPVAARAELHRSVTEQGVAKMLPVPTLPVAPGKPAVLAPGSYHFMLIGLKQPLVAGQTFPLTLTFANAGAVTTKITVMPFGANAGAGGMEGMDMGGMHHAMHP